MLPCRTVKGVWRPGRNITHVSDVTDMAALVVQVRDLVPKNKLALAGFIRNVYGFPQDIGDL